MLYPYENSELICCKLPTIYQQNFWKFAPIVFLEYYFYRITRTSNVFFPNNFFPNCVLLSPNNLQEFFPCSSNCSQQGWLGGQLSQYVGCSTLHSSVLKSRAGGSAGFSTAFRFSVCNYFRSHYLAEWTQTSWNDNCKDVTCTPHFFFFGNILLSDGVRNTQ